MSTLCDETYLDLCNQFAERSRRAVLHSINALNFSDDETEESLDDVLPSSFHYLWIIGKRSGSELLWAVEEEALYVSNGKIIAKDRAEAYTCNVKGCTGRVYMKPNGVAYKIAEHSVLHGSMYNTYMELQCRNHMREQCKIAGASKSVTDIFEEAVLLYVYTQHIFTRNKIKVSICLVLIDGIAIQTVKARFQYNLQQLSAL